MIRESNILSQIFNINFNILILILIFFLIISNDKIKKKIILLY